MNEFTESSSAPLEALREALKTADAVLIGAGAGLSASAGLTYSGERFEGLFSDFHEKYAIPDMYSGGFYPFETQEEYWAWWSRHILCNRYLEEPLPVYTKLLELVSGKEYFVLTTNVDHQFQRAGFDKQRLFYTQGDYGLWQCSKPCHQKTYDNEALVRKMVAEQRDMRIPTELIPHCPLCGSPMTMNLRSDDSFVQDDGWYRASERYLAFLRRYQDSKILFLELGVGYNTPGIIKYPFWQHAYRNPKALYACLNNEEPYVPKEIRKQSIVLAADIGETLTLALKGMEKPAEEQA